MTCKELVELVTNYLEDSLPPQERERFEAHLATCTGCNVYLDQIRKTITLLGTLTEDTIPQRASDELLHIFRNWKRGS
jgi:anti-sigma factor RsiW